MATDNRAQLEVQLQRFAKSRQKAQLNLEELMAIATEPEAQKQHDQLVEALRRSADYEFRIVVLGEFLKLQERVNKCARANEFFQRARSPITVLTVIAYGPS